MYLYKALTIIFIRPAKNILNHQSYHRIISIYVLKSFLAARKDNNASKRSFIRLVRNIFKPPRENLNELFKVDKKQFCLEPKKKSPKKEKAYIFLIRHHRRIAIKCQRFVLYDRLRIFLNHQKCHRIVTIGVLKSFFYRSPKKSVIKASMKSFIRPVLNIFKLLRKK